MTRTTRDSTVEPLSPVMDNKIVYEFINAIREDFSRETRALIHTKTSS